MQSLHYYLLSGPADLESLRIFGSKQIVWNRRAVTFYVLGTSHAVTMACEGRIFTELLSCVPVAHARVLQQSAASTCDVVSTAIGDVSYRCELTLFDLEKDGARGEGFDEEHRLDLTYDAVSAQSPPVTRIGWRDNSRTLVVRTYHTYPNEGRGVRSDTVFAERAT